nr:polysaccharide biosynthesis/export family protein [Jiella flava]
MSIVAAQGSLRTLPRGRFDPTRISTGDVIDVTIFDTGEKGLFSSTDSKSLDLGKFTVDSRGYVTLPFAGRQRVAGSTSAAVQRQIANALRGSAVNPQATVNIVANAGNLVTVDGSVGTPGQFPLSSGGSRVLDVIALAGGAKSSPATTNVTIQRGGHTASAPLAKIMANRVEDVTLMPGDRVSVGDQTGGTGASFTAYGSFKSTGEFKFEPGHLTLAKAIGRVGGLLDDKADPINVYLFRTQKMLQPVQTTAVKGSYKEQLSAPAMATTVTTSPIIVHINLKDPSSFLYMQQIQMQDDDILYATNAQAVDMAKYMTVFQKTPPLPAAPSPAQSGSSSGSGA